MAKHDYESMTTHDIMHCTRVYRISDSDRFDKVVRVVSTRVGKSVGFQDYWFSTARPTGAHRQDSDFWNDPNAVILVNDQFGRYIECPRRWDDGMAVDFEYIRI